MKTVVASIVGLAVGTVIAGLVVYGRFGPELDDVSAERSGLARELEASLRDLEALQARLAVLDRQNADMESQLAKVYGDLDAARNAVAPIPEDVVFEEDAVDMALGEADAPAEEGRRSRRSFWNDQLSEEDRERWEEQRVRMQEQFAQRAQVRRDFWDNELARASDPAVRERVAAMMEYDNYLGDLRGEFREVEDDESRALLVEDMRAAQQTQRRMQREHQNYLLQETAAAHGLKNPDEVDALVKDIRRTLSSPAFNSNQRGGPGRGGGGFGFRGGRGR